MEEVTRLLVASEECPFNRGRPSFLVVIHLRRGRIELDQGFRFLVGQPQNQVIVVSISVQWILIVLGLLRQQALQSCTTTTLIRLRKNNYRHQAPCGYARPRVTQIVRYATADRGGMPGKWRWINEAVLVGGHCLRDC